MPSIIKQTLDDSQIEELKYKIFCLDNRAQFNDSKLIHYVPRRLAYPGSTGFDTGDIKIHCAEYNLKACNVGDLKNPSFLLKDKFLTEESAYEEYKKALPIADEKFKTFKNGIANARKITEAKINIETDSDGCVGVDIIISFIVNQIEYNYYIDLYKD